MVAGAVDLWLLALGLGGVVLIGPLGQLLARTLFGNARPVHWLFLIFAGLLVVARLARRSTRRLVIYHVDGDALDKALRDALEPDRFVRTLGGYEDRTRACGIHVHHSPRWQTAVVEGFGRDADALIRALRPRLNEQLRLAPAGTAHVSMVFFEALGSNT